MTRYGLQVVVWMTALLLLSCATNESGEDSAETAVAAPRPALLSFSFLRDDNPGQMGDDVPCVLYGDSLVWTYAFMYENGFVPYFEYVGDSASINGDMLVKEDTVKTRVGALDFVAPQVLRVQSGEALKDYKLYVRNYCNVPSMWITTDDGEYVNSKEVYQGAHVKLYADAFDEKTLFESTLRIRGRGNTTWQNNKKPYKLKFHEKVSMLGLPEDKEWVLLANAFDPSAIRTELAFYLSRISQLDYTPRSQYVWVMLNGSYRGLYQLCDQVKISSDRVNVGDDGFLLEVDLRADPDDITFPVPHLPAPINVKDPDIEAGGSDYEYLRGRLCYIDSVLFSDRFTDEEDGYRSLIDVESFVDWYLVNEISKNPDSKMRSSCFMSLRKGEKLKMGPVWDFDIAFGSSAFGVTSTTDYDGIWTGHDNSWFERLFEDPYFVEAVRARYDYFYERKARILKEIDRQVEIIRFAVLSNNLATESIAPEAYSQRDTWNLYIEKIESLKFWLSARMDWLKEEFENM